VSISAASDGRIDLEVTRYGAQRCHDLAHELGGASATIREDVEVDTHIEPLEPECPLAPMPRPTASKPSDRAGALRAKARSMTSTAAGSEHRRRRNR